MQITKELRICSSTSVHVTATWVTKWQLLAAATDRLYSTRHNCATVWTWSRNCTAALLTACDSSKHVSFFYYFLHFISSLIHFLSYSVPPFYFISPPCINFLHLSPYFVPSIFYSSELFRASIPFFVSSCLSLFLSVYSFNRSYFHPLLYKFFAFSRFLPSFVRITSSLPLFHTFVFFYLFTLGRLYSQFPFFRY